jgi:hypothetical protein
MTTPPKVDPMTVDAKVAAIFKRHADRDDPHLDEMGHTPRDVLTYLRRRYPDFTPGLRADDLNDVAVLLLGKWWDDHREALFWLRQVVSLGANRREFAAVFGITSSQGFKDWLDRLEALLDPTGPGRPDEQAMRADRRSAAQEANRPATGEQRWVADNMSRYAELAQAAVGLYMDVDEDTAEQLSEVRRDVKDGAYTDGDPLVVLGLAVEALEECEVVVRRRHLEDGEQHTPEELARYAAAEADVRSRIEDVVGRWATLQQQRREAAGLS